MQNTYVWITWAFASMLATSLTYHPAYLASIFIACAIVARTYKIPIKGSIKAAILFGIPLLLINILFIHAGTNVLFEIPYTGSVTAQAIVSGAIFTLLMINMFCIFQIFNTLTTPDTLVRLVPSYLSHSTLLISIALRFVPTLSANITQITDAQRCRGLNLKKGNLLVRIKNHTSLIIPAIIDSLERSYNLAESIESRGYTKKRTKYKAEITTKTDKLAITLLLFFSLLFLYLAFSAQIPTWSLLNIETLFETISGTNPLIIISIFTLTIPIYKKCQK